MQCIKLELCNDSSYIELDLLDFLGIRFFTDNEIATISN